MRASLGLERARLAGRRAFAFGRTSSVGFSRHDQSGRRSDATVVPSGQPKVGISIGDCCSLRRRTGGMSARPLPAANTNALSSAAFHPIRSAPTSERTMRCANESTRSTAPMYQGMTFLKPLPVNWTMRAGIGFALGPVLKLGGGGVVHVAGEQHARGVLGERFSSSSSASGSNAQASIASGSVPTMRRVPRSCSSTCSAPLPSCRHLALGIQLVVPLMASKTRYAVGAMSSSSNAGPEHLQRRSDDQQFAARRQRRRESAPPAAEMRDVAGRAFARNVAAARTVVDSQPADAWARAPSNAT